MENSGAYMTETVFIKNYRDAGSHLANYEQICASGDAEMCQFIDQLPVMFATDADLCALLTDSNRLAQSQCGALHVYLDADQKNVIVHIISNLYLMYDKSLQYFQRVNAMADCVIIRPNGNETKEMYFSIRKDLA